MSPLVDLHLIFEVSKLQTRFLNLISCLFRTGFLLATQVIKIKFEVGKKSSTKINFKNLFRELEISKIKYRSPVLNAKKNLPEN